MGTCFPGYFSIEPRSDSAFRETLNLVTSFLSPYIKVQQSKGNEKAWIPGQRCTTSSIRGGSDCVKSGPLSIMNYLNN
jgi:hypothetical protein